MISSQSRGRNFHSPDVNGGSVEGEQRERPDEVAILILDLVFTDWRYRVPPLHCPPVVHHLRFVHEEQVASEATKDPVDDFRWATTSASDTYTLGSARAMIPKEVKLDSGLQDLIARVQEGFEAWVFFFMAGEGVGGKEVGLEERAGVEVEVRGRAASDEDGVVGWRVSWREPALKSLSCEKARC
ncbi:hypothetical protein NL676_028030 [Syzygium grande]|nr:hypothetical protein NL676_028030 [Syzygium grande]